mmetsp:Transcript_30612/g.60738  ORF Transcript_30612/g.60738 Transcript_30612/m.60738 type:complete len:255 (+) Transcript_30612:210-974(+)
MTKNGTTITMLLIIFALLVPLTNSLPTSPPSRRTLLATGLLLPPYACCASYACKNLRREHTYPASFNGKLASTFGSVTRRPGRRILELGGGKNLVSILEAGCYSGEEHLVVVDPVPPSPSKREEAEALFAGRGGSVTFQDSLDAEGLTPPYDAATSSLTLCSVADPVETLRKLSSLLKHEAPYAFVEHVASDDTLFSLQQRVFDPLQQRLANGCHLQRRIQDDISSVFSRVEFKRSFEEDMWPISEQINGVAYI